MHVDIWIVAVTVTVMSDESSAIRSNFSFQRYAEVVFGTDI